MDAVLSAVPVQAVTAEDNVTGMPVDSSLDDVKNVPVDTDGVDGTAVGAV